MLGLRFPFRCSQCTCDGLLPARQLLLGNRACSLFMHTVRLIHGHVLPVLRRVDVNNGPFPSRIGLPHSILAETDRHACIIPPASLGIRSPTCARWSTRKR